jgi:hypothetical protein
MPRNEKPGWADCHRRSGKTQTLDQRSRSHVYTIYANDVLHVYRISTVYGVYRVLSMQILANLAHFNITYCPAMPCEKQKINTQGVFQPHQ